MSSILHQAVIASLGNAAAAGGVAAPTLTGSPTLAASWDFDNPGTITLSGGDIDQIVGSDGTSYTLLTPGNMPSQEARGGKNAARFTAASTEYMQIASDLGVLMPITLVVIAEPAATGVTQALIDHGLGTASTANDRNMIFANSASTGWTMSRRRSGAVDAVRNVSYSAAKVCLVGRSPSGTTNSYLNVDGNGTAYVSAATNAGPTSVTHTTLGARRASSTQDLYFDGWVWRVLVYSANLTDTNVEEIATWAASNYGTGNVA